jgi:hypothetical protein
MKKGAIFGTHGEDEKVITFSVAENLKRSNLLGDLCITHIKPSY